MTLSQNQLFTEQYTAIWMSFIVVMTVVTLIYFFNRRGRTK